MGQKIEKPAAPENMVTKTATRESWSGVRTDATRDALMFEEGTFQAMLTRERRRAERSGKPFVLMLLDAHQENGNARTILAHALEVIAAATRQTDTIGWYKQSAIAGVIFTELGREGKSVDKSTIVEGLSLKIRARLLEDCGHDRAAKIALSFHFFPEHWDRNHAGWTADSKLYPDLEPQVPQQKLALTVKRAMDLLASSALLLLLAPILAAIAVLIKFTSKGPVLFEQERMGKFGRRFKCLKFRTMYLANDSTVHEKYVQQFIAGGPEAVKANAQSDGKVVYKITNDQRVTSIGRLLRKTSLDELPQFWNVVRGEMSLVGPRPPVPYEFELYDFWHRRRVLEVKPGITGLWQVNGRSRTQFNEMVRLDLQYCESWSLWLDLKILLATPQAVFFGEGAY